MPRHLKFKFEVQWFNDAEQAWKIADTKPTRAEAETVMKELMEKFPKFRFRIGEWTFNVNYRIA